MNPTELRVMFGNGLRVCRQQRGFTQEKLAARSGLHRTYISDVERGFRNLSLLAIAKLAEALEISLPELLQAGLNTLPARPATDPAPAKPLSAGTISPSAPPAS